jgi:hypothetical protein
MTTSRSDTLLTILQDFFNPREEGWLWLATYRDDEDGGTVEQVEGAYEEPVATAHGIADIVTNSGAHKAYIALCRAEAQPLESDRELWRVLRGLLGARR